MDEQSDPRAAHAGQHAPRTRKHMGVATSDPEYLPPVQDTVERMPGHGRGGRHAHSGRAANAGRNSNPLHYDRYLSAPQRGRAIFSAQRTRHRRRNAVAVLAILLIAAVCIAAAYFLLH